MKSCYLLLCCALICVTPIIALSASNPFQDTNPFQGAIFYVNPTYLGEVSTALNAYPSYSKLLFQVQNVSTANWLDTTAKIGNITKILADAQSISTSTLQPVVVPFVIYNLPDRDCSAGASNGEILCADANCTAGIAQYENDYIDPIVQAFSDYPNVRIVTIIEPDALANMATNANSNYPKCVQGQTAYFQCISYAVQQFAALGNVWSYLDAAHGGWLGWESNREAYISVVNYTLSLVGGIDWIRGFATDVSNYQPLGSNSSTNDPCGLLAESNEAIDEVHYARLLYETATTAGFSDLGFIIDTSRDGVPNSRVSCNDWCNIKNAGFGVFPTADTADSGLPYIDAYYWVKTPGESDGTSNTSSSRYDPTCTSVDAMIPAPEAGLFWPAYFLNLALNSPYITQLPMTTTTVHSGSVTLALPMVLLVCISILSILLI